MVKEFGCVLFEIVFLESVFGRFVLWEIWQNQDVFYYYYEQNYIKEFFVVKFDMVEFFESLEIVDL